MYWLDNELWFPPVEDANLDGVIAVGGDLNPDRLLLAYSNGIFPWFNPDEPPIWWCPDPRFVILPEELRISKSMKQLLRREAFEFRVNTAFSEVIRGCASMPRNEAQGGTWITDEFVESYTQLHHAGHVHCAEAWRDGRLVGGLYGVRIGKVFCGESMFARESNASKYAFIKYVQHLLQEGVTMIDCQVHTPHLESLGGRMIPRKQFLVELGVG